MSEIAYDDGGATEDSSFQTAKVQELKEQISHITEQVAALSVKTPRRSASVVCYRCQQPGHIQ